MALALSHRENSAPTRRPWIGHTLLVGPLIVVFALAVLEFARGEHALDRVILFGLPDPLSGSQPVGPSRLVDFAWNVTALGSPDIALPVALVIGAGFVLARRAWEGIFVMISVTGGAAMGYLLKKATSHVRPHHGMDEFGQAVMNTSFPSGHAMMATMLGLAVAVAIARAFPKNWPLRAYVFVVAVLFAGVVGISRCYLGFHWPSDTFAGWSVAALWVWVCCLTFGKLAPGPSADQ